MSELQRRDFLKASLLTGIGLVLPFRGRQVQAIDLRRISPLYNPQETKQIHDYLMAVDPRETQQLLNIVAVTPWSDDSCHPQRQLMLDLGNSDKLYLKILAYNDREEAVRHAAKVGLPRPRVIQRTKNSWKRMDRIARRYNGQCLIVVEAA